jgi:CheY-like chemotaxis protein
MSTENKNINSITYDWSNKSILIADDELMNLKLIEKSLQPTKIKIFIAQNGEQAVQIFQNNPTISIILMDIRMPNMDGVEAIKIIRKENRTIPIIAFTAYALTNDEVNALNYGCNDYISKPSQPQFILQKINEFLK